MGSKRFTQHCENSTEKTLQGDGYGHDVHSDASLGCHFIKSLRDVLSEAVLKLPTAL